MPLDADLQLQNAHLGFTDLDGTFVTRDSRKPARHA
jgi:hypothetical protein